MKKMKPIHKIKWKYNDILAGDESILILLSNSTMKEKNWIGNNH